MRQAGNDLDARWLLQGQTPRITTMNNPNLIDEVELRETVTRWVREPFQPDPVRPSDPDEYQERWRQKLIDRIVSELIRATPPTPVSTAPETELDVMCPHGWARDVACDECGRSGFRWIGINAEGGNKLTPIEITGVWLMRKGSENDPKARVEVHVELPDGWHHVITEPLGANFSHAVSPSGIRQSPLSEWANPASPLTVPAEEKFEQDFAEWQGQMETEIEATRQSEIMTADDMQTRINCTELHPTAQGEAEVRTAPIGPIAGGASHEPTCGVWRGSSCDCVTRINNLAQREVKAAEGSK